MAHQSANKLTEATATRAIVPLKKAEPPRSKPNRSVVNAGRLGVVWLAGVPLLNTMIPEVGVSRSAILPDVEDDQTVPGVMPPYPVLAMNWKR